VKKQLKNIFEFRFRKVEELFGKWHAAQLNVVEFGKAA